MRLDFYWDLKLGLYITINNVWELIIFLCISAEANYGNQGLFVDGEEEGR